MKFMNLALDIAKKSGKDLPIGAVIVKNGEIISTAHNLKEAKEKTMAADNSIKGFEKIRDGYRFFVANTEKATELIVSDPSVFKDYEITKGKMDDVFLAVTGKSLHENDAPAAAGGSKKRGGAR